MKRVDPSSPPGEVTEVLWHNPYIRFTLLDDHAKAWDILWSAH